VADIRPPDFATRVAILCKRAALDRIRLDDNGVLELIAQRVTNNVRSLEGALIRVVAHHSLTGDPINLSLTTKVLDGMYPETRSDVLTIEAIQETVAAYYELTVTELVSPSRSASVAWPRQLALHLSRQLTDGSLQSIGRAFGGRNHATVLHACKRVSQRLADDQQAGKELADLSAIIRQTTSRPG
jgi:chromosomal replication initiator protein